MQITHTAVLTYLYRPSGTINCYAIKIVNPVDKDGTEKLKVKHMASHHINDIESIGQMSHRKITRDNEP